MPGAPVLTDEWPGCLVPDMHRREQSDAATGEVLVVRRLCCLGERGEVRDAPTGVRTAWRTQGPPQGVRGSRKGAGTHRVLSGTSKKSAGDAVGRFHGASLPLYYTVPGTSFVLSRFLVKANPRFVDASTISS